MINRQTGRGERTKEEQREGGENRETEKLAVRGEILRNSKKREREKNVSLVCSYSCCFSETV